MHPGRHRDPDRADGARAAGLYRGHLPPLLRRRGGHCAGGDLARDRRAGLPAQAEQHLLHLPRMVHRLFLRGFRPLPRPLQRKPFRLSRSHLRFLAELLHHQPRRARDGRIADRSEDDDLHHRHQLFRRIRRSRDFTRTPSAACSNGSGARSGRRRTNSAAPCCRTMPPSSTPSPGTNIRSAKSSTA